jgi:hypothetical protein
MATHLSRISFQFSEVIQEPRNSLVAFLYAPRQSSFCTRTRSPEEEPDFICLFKSRAPEGL